MSAGSVRNLGMPAVGASVPGWVVRAAFAIVGIALSIACYQQPLWITVGAGLTGYGALAPRRLATWLLLPFLAASQLTRHPSFLDWRFMTLLAGLHLLQVLAAQLRQLPPRVTVQLVVLGRPLLRFVAIQVPVQLVAVGVLASLAPSGGRRFLAPGFGVVGAAALLVIAMLLVVPRRRGHR